MTRCADRFRVNSLNDLQTARNNRGRIVSGGYSLTPSDCNDLELREGVPNLIAAPRCMDHTSFQREILGYWGNATLQVQSEKYNYIKNYNYIPDKFHFNKINNSTDKLYLGIELEIDKGGKKDEVAKYIIDTLGKNSCYIVHDGSLNNGLEIVSHPGNVEFHKSLPYKTVFKELSKLGYKSHDTQTCGYHIHINRDFFSNNPTIQDLCITKILYLIEKYWIKVKLIARRDSNEYSRRFNMKEKDSMFDLLVRAKGEHASKYNAINLRHSDTIEFRMFKGTLKYETFIATMEFIYNLAYLCKETPLENIQNVGFKDILDYKPYEYLNDYIQCRMGS